MCTRTSRCPPPATVRPPTRRPPAALTELGNLFLTAADKRAAEVEAERAQKKREAGMTGGTEPGPAGTETGQESRAEEARRRVMAAMQEALDRQDRREHGAEG